MATKPLLKIPTSYLITQSCTQTKDKSEIASASKSNCFRRMCKSKSVQKLQVITVDNFYLSSHPSVKGIMREIIKKSFFSPQQSPLRS